jgi:hypothetical protein
MTPKIPIAVSSSASAAKADSRTIGSIRGPSRG